MTAETQRVEEEPYFTSAETQERLKISREKLRQLIKEGELTAFKIGNGKTSDLRVTGESILAFIARHTVRASP